MKGDKLATLGGGCFWCLEPLFDQLNGVKKVEVGYAGGDVDNPTYREVCSEDTGHAEVIQITYDPSVVSYRELLEVFFTVHDPTTPNQQGYDVGSQYRSIILYHDEEQQRVADEVIKEFNTKVWSGSIVTEVVECDKFYRAEEYHQNYYRKNPMNQYCRMIIDPKVTKFRKHFLSKLTP